MRKGLEKNAFPSTDNRLLRLHRSFDPIMVMYHHPVRLTISLLIPLMLLPELSVFLQFLTDISGLAADTAVLFGIVFLIFLPQLLIEALDCQYIHFDFYDTHFQFTETFFLKEPIRIYYRSITDISVSQNKLQKPLKLSSLVFTIEPPADYVAVKTRIFRIDDVRDGEAVCAQIQRLIERYQIRKSDATTGKN